MPCLIPEGCPKEPGDLPAIISALIGVVLVVVSVTVLMSWMKITLKKALAAGVACVVFSAVIIAVGILLNQSIDGNKLIAFTAIAIYLGFAAVIAMGLRSSSKIEPQPQPNESS